MFVASCLPPCQLNCGAAVSVKERYFEIQLSNKAGTSIPARLNCEATHWNEGGFHHRVCRITLSYGDSEIECSDRDYFEAFCRVREQLERVDVTPLCYGASRNVFPSGMCRDMGDGLRAYRMQMGRKVGRGDMVSIFDSGPDIDPVSVEIQKEFFNKWLGSFKG